MRSIPRPGRSIGCGRSDDEIGEFTARRFRALVSLMRQIRSLRSLAAGLAVLVGLSSVARAEIAASFVPEADTIPDLTPTDAKGKFAGGGRMFCGPVAVSNSLMAMLK